MRKIFAILLSVLMVASLLSFSISAEEPAYAAKIVKADNTEKTYATVASAAVELQNGDTMTIYGTVNETVEILPPNNGTVTVIGAEGNKLTKKFLVKDPGSSATVFVKGLNIEVSDATAFQVQDNVTATFEQMNVTASGQQVFNPSGSTNTNIHVTIKYSTLTETGTGANFGYGRAGAEVTYENCYINNLGDKTAFIVDKKNDGGFMKFVNCLITSKKGFADGGKDTNNQTHYIFENCVLDYIGKDNGLFYFKKGDGMAATFDFKNTTILNEGNKVFFNINTSSAINITNCNFVVSSAIAEACTFTSNPIPGFVQSGVLSSGMAVTGSLNSFQTVTQESLNLKLDPVQPAPAPVTPGSDDPTPATGDNFAALVMVLGAAVLTAGTVLVVRKKED